MFFARATRLMGSASRSGAGRCECCRPPPCRQSADCATPTVPHLPAASLYREGSDAPFVVRVVLHRHAAAARWRRADSSAGDRHAAAHLHDAGFRRESVWRSALDRRRSEEHTSELQSHVNLVCRLLLEKKKKKIR